MKTHLLTAAALAVISLSACNGADDTAEAEETVSQPGQEMSDEDKALASMNYAEGSTDNFEAPEHMLLQVTLDSIGFSPGVIDGEMGQSTKNALMAFQEAEGLDPTGQYGDETKQALSASMLSSATRVVTIPPSWANAEYKKLPEDAPEQAKLEKLGYESLWERLAERFHTTPETLYGLNPDLCNATAADAKSGAETKSSETESANDTDSSSMSSASTSTDTSVSSTNSESSNSEERLSYQKLSECKFTGSLASHKLRVPNISDGPIEGDGEDERGWDDTLASLGVLKDQPKAAKLVVDKSDGIMRIFDKDEKLIAAYTVTSGSSRDPLPLGDWKINGVSKNPEFSYDPDLFWDVPDSEPDQMLPPGPNGPVGVVWIDLSKELYGIHGTSAPATIGTAQSHGCVRLTNWDAAELAQMVDSSTEVVFQA